jgi:DNA-binding LacI/PurR family transcriptional regulator
MTTIGDVAREAGVSRSTVSSVLTGRKNVTPATRSRIEAAIEKLNFTVNSGARALATSRTMVFGVVVQLHGLEFSPALAPFVFALSDAARAEGYDVLLMTEADAVAAIKRVSRERRVDGLVLLNIVDDDPRLPALESQSIPAVLLGMPRDSRGVDAVDLDFAAAARKLVSHLHERGHRDVLFARWSPMMFEAGHAFVLRFNDAAFASARELGMTLRPFDCPVEPELVPAALARALRERGSATAVLVHNDAATALLPSALHEAGLSVPDDIAVVSLHSAELGRAFALPYTSVESDPGRVAAASIAVLLRRIAAGENDDLGVSHELLAPRITDRGSVPPPA